MPSRIACLTSALLATWLLTPATSSAHYTRMSLVHLIGFADVSVVGTITSVEELDFAVRVDISVFGDVQTGDTIRVERFQDWPCAWRWAPYQVDQQVLLFLARGKEDGPFRILGAGDEGELRVEGDQVEPNFLLGPPLVNGLTPSNLTLPLIPFCNAIADCRASYRLSPVPKRGMGRNDDNPVWLLVELPKPTSPPPITRSGFKKRYPPGTKPKPVAFEDRSPYHQFLKNEIKLEWMRADQRKN